MILILLIGLILLATAVALIARGVIDARLRTSDNLMQIGQYGFAGTPELKPTGGMRGFIDSAADGIGIFLTERLKVMNEDRLRKTLVMAGMYNTSPRTLIGYQLLGALALILTVLGEMLTAQGGLGYVILLAARSFNAPRLYAAIILLALLGAAANLIILLAERRLTAWNIQRV